MRFSILSIAIPALLAAQNPNIPVENESVRVLSVTDAPVAKPGNPHEHKENRVMIYLDSGDMQLRYANGKEEKQHWKPGDVAWSPANGIHTSQNVSPRPIRIVEIEIRKPGAAGAAAPPDRTNALIDNSQVRVYRSSKPPAAKDYVAVNVESAQVTWDKLPEGSGPFVITEIK